MSVMRKPALNLYQAIQALHAKTCNLLQLFVTFDICTSYNAIYVE